MTVSVSCYLSEQDIEEMTTSEEVSESSIFLQGGSVELRFTHGALYEFYMKLRERFEE